MQATRSIYQPYADAEFEKIAGLDIISSDNDL
jgi:hypothetical protein